MDSAGIKGGAVLALINDISGGGKRAKPGEDSLTKHKNTFNPKTKTTKTLNTSLIPMQFLKTSTIHLNEIISKPIVKH